MTEMPKTMKAMVLTGHGGFDKYEWHKDWPVPEPGPDDVLIRVSACGVNNTDVNTRVGWYAKEVREATRGDGYGEIEKGTWGGSGTSFPRIQGADICGQVVAVGANADPALIGKRVIADPWIRDWSDPLDREKARYFGSEVDGGFAEYCVIDHRNVAAIESPLSDAELATFACSYTTAEGMLSRARVGEGDRVLITGASGGVGSALVQLANRRGAITIAMASPEKHAELARLVQPRHLIERNPADLGAALEAATGQARVDVVADVVGGASFPALLEHLVRGGRYVTSGAIAGPIVELDLRTLYLNDLEMHGSTVVPPHIFRDLVSYIERGEIRPVLAATYPLEKLKEAQQAFIEKRHIGKIVVTM